MTSMVDREKPKWTQHTEVWRDDDTPLLNDLREKANEFRHAQRVANDYRAELNTAILLAKADGHSYAQIKDATGMGTGAIQLILAKAGYSE
jgi:DNA-directed RNA polymerase specialized sigma24 family protein